jgi:hypothetical protein
MNHAKAALGILLKHALSATEPESASGGGGFGRRIWRFKSFRNSPSKIFISLEIGDAGDAIAGSRQARRS